MIPMRDLTIEFVGTMIGGMVALFFEKAMRHRLRPRPVPPPARPRPGGYWN